MFPCPPPKEHPNSARSKEGGSTSAQSDRRAELEKNDPKPGEKRKAVSTDDLDRKPSKVLGELPGF